MNTKFKKTALEDDAEIYQHGTKSATKDDIKKLPPKKRIAYFCDYYLAKCLVVLALIICIILIMRKYQWKTTYPRTFCRTHQ